METETTTDQSGHRVTHRHRLHWFERTLASLAAASAVVIAVIEVGRVVGTWRGY